MLELLWDLAHLPAIATPHLQHALEEQLAILSDSITVNMTVKHKYIGKCVGDIKKVREGLKPSETRPKQVPASLSQVHYKHPILKASHKLKK